LRLCAFRFSKPRLRNASTSEELLERIFCHLCSDRRRRSHPSRTIISGRGIPAASWVIGMPGFGARHAAQLLYYRLQGCCVMVDRLFERDETRAVLTAAEIRTEHDVHVFGRDRAGPKRSGESAANRMGPPPLLREPYQSGHYEELCGFLLVSQNIHFQSRCCWPQRHRCCTCEGRHPETNKNPPMPLFMTCILFSRNITLI
jgi:hypothetical protein